MLSALARRRERHLPDARSCRRAQRGLKNQRTASPASPATRSGARMGSTRSGVGVRDPPGCRLGRARLGAVSWNSSGRAGRPATAVEGHLVLALRLQCPRLTRITTSRRLNQLDVESSSGVGRTRRRSLLPLPVCLQPSWLRVRLYSFSGSQERKGYVGEKLWAEVCNENRPNTGVILRRDKPKFYRQSK